MSLATTAEPEEPIMTTQTAYLVVTTPDSVETVERYLYSSAKVVDHQSFEVPYIGRHLFALVRVEVPESRNVITDAASQAERLRSGLHGAEIFTTLERAQARLAEREVYLDDKPPAAPTSTWAVTEIAHPALRDVSEDCERCLALAQEAVDLSRASGSTGGMHQAYAHDGTPHSVTVARVIKTLEV